MSLAKKRNYNISDPVISKLERKYVNDCLETGWISSLGKYVEKFEKNFSKFSNTKYAISTCNGTVSLHLILLALGISKGDDVIVPNFSYVATLNAVLYVGANPILIDCDNETYNIDHFQIENKITKKTKAIIITHLYGNPCQMDKISEIAKRHNICLIEDAAEAHGAIFKNKIIGSFGIANSFSFFGNKTISTGEGGMVTTNSKKIADVISLLKNQGQHPKDKKYFHRIMGYNYRMTNIQAALGCSQLKKLKLFVAKKRLVNKWYRENLSLLVNDKIISFQKETNNASSSWWMTAMTINNNVNIDKLAKRLGSVGIRTRPFFAPMNKLPYIKNNEKFPNSEYVYNRGIILPSGVNLNEEDIKIISKNLLNNLI